MFDESTVMQHLIENEKFMFEGYISVDHQKKISEISEDD